MKKPAQRHQAREKWRHRQYRKAYQHESQTNGANVASAIASASKRRRNEIMATYHESGGEMAMAAARKHRRKR
jgi:hypothetical protein